MNIRTVQRLIVITTMLAPHAKAAQQIIDTVEKIGRISFFLITSKYNNWEQGPFDFNLMLDDGPPKVVVAIENEKLRIQHMSNGKGPIFVSKYPVTFRNEAGKETTTFEEIRNFTKNKFHNKKFNDKTPIHCFTYNDKDEKGCTNIGDIVRGDQAVTFYPYPTPDWSAPSLEDLEKQADAIERYGDEEIMFLHCKAGKGRSITGFAAYVIRLFIRSPKVDRNGNPYTLQIKEDQIVDAAVQFAKDKRKVASLHGTQVDVLKKFCRIELEKHKKDLEIKTPQSTTSATPATSALDTPSTPAPVPTSTVITPTVTTTPATPAPSPAPAPAPTIPTATTQPTTPPQVTTPPQPATPAPATASVSTSTAILPSPTTPPTAVTIPIAPVPSTTTPTSTATPSITTTTATAPTPSTPTIADNKKPQQQGFSFFKWASNLFARNTQKNITPPPTPKLTANRRGFFGWFWSLLGY